MRSTHASLVVVALLAAIVTLALTPQPAQAKSKDWQKVAAGVVVGLILADVFDDDGPRYRDSHYRDYHHQKGYYYRCPYCAYYGPYRGQKWIVRYHSHGHRIVVRKGPWGTRIHYYERPNGWHRGHGHSYIGFGYHSW